jgi:hypothetical protein
MKMIIKKVVSIVFAILAAVILLSACNGDDSTVVINLAKITEEIAINVKYDDQLVLLNPSNIAQRYNFGKDVKSIIVYAGSGATAEEIIAIETENPQQAKAVVEDLKTYLNDMKANFKDYNPPEMKKLNDPVLMNIGKYAIYCVSPDPDSVRNIIDSYLR